MAVQEDDVGRKAVVIFYDVGQVGHCFATLVAGNGCVWIRRGVIKGVFVDLPTIDVSQDGFVFGFCGEISGG